MDRTHPQLTPKEAKAKARQQAIADRNRELSRQDASPGRTLMRNFVDTRFNLAEYSMPLLLGMLAVSVVGGWLQSTVFIEWTLYLTWVVFGAIILDLAWMWIKFKKLAAERLPGESLKGLGFYGVNRALSLRRNRVPAVQLARGDKF